jgi:hypothetical protein
MDTDQKKDENMEMESNWDEVVETFDELNLKKDLLRGKKSLYLYQRYLRLWFRKTFSYSTKSYFAHNSRKRYNRPSSIRNW